MSEPLMQPWLHDRSILVSAPAQVWADSDGTIGTRAIDGIFFGDRRVFSGYRFELGDVEPAHVATERVDSATTRIVALARQFSGPTADPRVLVERRRTLTPGRLTETIRVANALPTPVETTLRVALVAADDDMQAVKGGEPSVPVDIVASEHAWSAVGATGTRATVSADGARGDAQGPVLSLMWDIRIPANELVTVSWRLDLGGTSLVDAAQSDAEWADVQVRTGDPRVGRWLERSLSDLEKLRMVVRTDHADQEFLAAGAPWYFTLFGRDSLWAARFMLPLGTRLAEGTLSTLAERQGTRTVPETAEQPGKILHELRAATVNDATGNTVLPPLYYGTIDATCLWISLLAEAWDWGMPEDSIRTLLPNLEAALRWMDEFGDADGDGFLEYQDVTGHGLANQGWKDSSDSVQWNDGTLAQGPIALCEVQGYAYKAALDGARLLEHFGRPGAQHWRQWAAELK
ncbi:MAG TPA: amylo-alpha-1,6-glucosidase, partial [Pseudoclavibacter sp.]|nr:amylo-alpha-1,6-glucosidase [Pseudoclavibacter sp.]